MAERFDRELEELGIRLSEEQKDQFHKYYEMLVEWNKVMNLTGITDYDEVNLKHFTEYRLRSCTRRSRWSFWIL